MKRIFLISTLFLALPIQANTSLSPKARIFRGCIAIPSVAAAVTLFGACAFFFTKLGISFYKDLKKEIECEESKPISKLVSFFGMIYSGKFSILSLGATLTSSAILAEIVYSVAIGNDVGCLFLQQLKNDIGTASS